MNTCLLLAGKQGAMHVVWHMICLLAQYIMHMAMTLLLANLC